MQGQTGSTASLRRALLAPLAALSLGAAAIHFAVVDAHFQEWWAFGVFIATIAWFQALWPMAYVLVPSVRMALIGALVNFATAGVWAWSRFAALPFGPGAGRPIPVGLIDVVTTAFEVLLVVGLVLFAVTPVGRRLGRYRLRRSAATLGPAAAVLVVAVAASVAITFGAYV